MSYKRSDKVIVQDLKSLLRLLIHGPVDFVLVGGFAAVLHGGNQATRDIDICVLYSPEQIQLLRETLRPYHPLHRMQEPKQSFLESPQDISQKQDFHLITDLGVLDVISHIEGVGGYYDVLKNSEEIELYGGTCFLISIEDLIRSKRALGRYRDLVTILELEAIQIENTKTQKTI